MYRQSLQRIMRYLVMTSADVRVYDWSARCGGGVLQSQSDRGVPEWLRLSCRRRRHDRFLGDAGDFAVAREVNVFSGVSRGTGAAEGDGTDVAAY